LDYRKIQPKMGILILSPGEEGIVGGERKDFAVTDGVHSNRKYKRHII